MYAKGDLLMKLILQQIMEIFIDFLQYQEKKILEDDSSNFFAEFMKDLTVVLDGVGVTIGEGFLKIVDDHLYQAAKENKGFQVKEKERKRTLITKHGEMVLSRRYYREKATGRYVYLLDEYLNLKPHQRVDPVCAANIVEKVLDMSYAKAAKEATVVPISRQTVKNLVHALPTPPHTYKQTIDSIAADTVYIEVDEDHIHLQDGKSAHVKLATVYTEKKQVGTHRVQLVNKHALAGMDRPSTFWKSIQEYIEDTYLNNPNIVIIGDGANWIKRGLEYFPDSVFVLDAYHLDQGLRRVSGPRFIGQLKEYILTDNKVKFMDHVERELKKHPKRIKTILASSKYIMNQWEYAKRTLERDDVSSSTEAQVSHTLSARLSSRPLGWSRHGVNQIAKLRVLRNNEDSIRDFVVQSSMTFEDTREKLQIPPNMKKAKRGIKNYKYITYMPDISVSIPGSESSKIAFLKAFKNSGITRW